MNRLLDLIFGFAPGTFGAPDTQIGFRVEIASWIVFIALLALSYGVYLSYRGLPGKPSVRLLLGTLRVCVLMLLMLLALGPRIERARTLVERDHVIALLDVSGSMLMPATSTGESTTTRAAQLAESIATHKSIFEQIGKESNLEFYQFSGTAVRSDSVPFEPDMIHQNASTSLHASMQSAISAVGTSPISGIVVFSDGQSSDAMGDDLAETLLRSNIPIISVPLGSPDPVRDASIIAVESPSSVFAKDRIPVRVRGFAAGHSEGDELRLQLVEKGTNQVLNQTVATVDASNELVADLSTSFDEPGEHNLVVRIESDSSDIVASNNEQDISIRIVDQPMRVLYVDGHPRWEYRYLKNLLIREDSIDATTILLAADRRFIEEGQELQGTIPNTLDEWEDFDVVILGDVRPELFSQSQLESLIEHIEVNGCGFLWIAGEGATPSAWTESTLASLLPMQQGKIESLSARSFGSRAAVLSLTNDAERIGILQLEDGEQAQVSDSTTGWSIMRWTSPIPNDALKPGVSVLAEALPIDGGAQGALVTQMRYGGGRIGYVGTDEIWRWRYGKGEDLPERFWLPIIRSLGQGTIDRRASAARVQVWPKNAMVGQDVRITLDLFDRAIIDSLPSKIPVSIQQRSNAESDQVLELAGSEEYRRAAWTPNEPDMYELRIEHPLLGSVPLTQTFRVYALWDETTNPNTDHKLLADLSEQTQGSVLPLDQLDSLPDLLPNRTRITTLAPQTTPLWDRPIVLIVLVLLLGTEWIGRRVLRLA